MSKAKLASKRILEVKIKHLADTDPDTSYYGEYAKSPSSEFSIDRATDAFQGDIGAGLDWLSRIESHLQGYCEEHINISDDACEDCEKETEDQRALRAIEELKDGEPFNVSWNNREYRYFNPSDNYQGEPAEEIRKYVRQDYERMESYNRQNWYYIGIRAEARVQITAGGPIQDISSGGLWGTESDSGQDHLDSIEQEEIGELKSQLTALGFSKRAIATAFKTIKREES